MAGHDYVEAPISTSVCSPANDDVIALEGEGADEMVGVLPHALDPRQVVHHGPRARRHSLRDVFAPA